MVPGIAERGSVRLLCNIQYLTSPNTRTDHANSAPQGLSRFATCVLQSGVELPYSAIKANIAAPLNLIVQIERRPGKRFVSEVLEVQLYDPTTERYSFETIFRCDAFPELLHEERRYV